ncbi:MAG: hypothetical protein AB2598_17280 [Candidatus Thiodiazotropha sp.]
MFPVRSGDLIDINSDDGEVRLRMADESIRSLTKESMPYTVDLQVKAPTVISNLMQWVGGWLTDQHDTRQKKIASLVIRGEKPRPRFVFGLADHEDDAAALLAHERPLFFSIKGGEPPFRLKIFSSDGQMPIIDLPELSAREIHTPSIKLAPGDYRVEIDDLNKQRGKGYFKTLPGQKLPEFPDIQADGSELDQLLTLTWLAAYGDGEWLYESYQRAAQLAQHSYPARLVRDALARGYIPESPGE